MKVKVQALKCTLKYYTKVKSIFSRSRSQLLIGFLCTAKINVANYVQEDLPDKMVVCLTMLVALDPLLFTHHTSLYWMRAGLF